MKLKQMVADLAEELEKWAGTDEAPDPAPVPTPAPTPVAQLVVAIVNVSTAATNAEVQAALTDLQAQVSQDFAPLWGTDAQLVFGQGFRTGAEWVLKIEDDSPYPGALGYHEDVRGVPTGHVYVRTSEAGGVAWQSVASHELLEMLADPRANMAVVEDTSPNQDGTQGTLFMAECCDAVEQSTYTKGSTSVSNFVTPAWFDPAATSGPFDFLRKLNGPLILLPGGSYIGTLDFTSSGWRQKTAHKSPTSEAT